MAKRDTVKVDCNKIDNLRKANEWNQSAFSRKVGKYSSWDSEVLRGKNLPSPEEAARICVLFNAAPTDILIHEGKTPEETAKCLEDIETVQGFVDGERAKEKAPAAEGEGEAKLAQFVDGFMRLTPQQKDTVLALIKGFLQDQA